MALTSGFANGAGQIWLDDVACTGNELTLISCSHPPLGQHNCVHSEDAGVRCTVATNGKYNGGVMLFHYDI